MAKFKLKLARLKDIEAENTLVMAIINATPDSFSDGGELSTSGDLEKKIKELAQAGADILDVGGESTRPGHQKVPAAEEIERVVPAIKTIRKFSKTIPISIDTHKAAVAEAALRAGANFINDVSALSDPQMAEVVKKYGCSIVLMRNQPLSKDVIKSCRKQLAAIVKNAESGGISREQIILDPGLGFGDLAKNDFVSLPGGSPSANMQLMLELSAYSGGLPVLIGASRKRFLGEMSGQKIARERTVESLAAALIAAYSDAAIVRVHDAPQTSRLLN